MSIAIFQFQDDSNCAKEEFCWPSVERTFPMMLCPGAGEALRQLLHLKHFDPGGPVGTTKTKDQGPREIASELN